MQVVFSAERENVKSHAVPLLAHHLGQVAIDHACKQCHMQFLSAPNSNFASSVPSHQDAEDAISMQLSLQACILLMSESKFQWSIYGASTCKQHAHMHAYLSIERSNH